MRIRFLADADLDQDIVTGLLRREPDMDFEVPQGLIPEGTKDPQVLAVAASLGRILVSHDVQTMAGHFGNFIAIDDSPGLILIPRSMPIGRVIDEIQLVWQVCEAEEWINLFRRFPL